MADIAILGSGGWGMALAVSAHLSGNNVTLWSPFDEEVKMLTEKRCNEKLLSGIVLPDGIKITSDISCVSGSALTILAKRGGTACRAKRLRHSCKRFKGP